MKRSHGQRRRRVIAIGKVLLWALAFLALEELVVGFAVRLPSDPRRPTSSLGNYFNYGRSIEGKLKRSLSASDDGASPVMFAGWINKDCRRQVIARPTATSVISFYGMSFSSHVSVALEQFNPSYQTVRFAGPGAPPNHSYACFLEQDAFRQGGSVDESHVVVLGVLSSSVAGMLSMTGATTGFESPAPFTYPRYRLDGNGQLLAVRPIINSTDEWRRALSNPFEMRAWVDQLAAHDEFFDRWSFTANPGDYSFISRLVHRAYGQGHTRRVQASVFGPSGFIDRPDIGPVLKFMVADFAKRVHAAGKRPVILLIQARGSGRSLSIFLEPTLRAENIDYLNTDAAAASNDPANYLADGHLTPQANGRIARDLAKLIGSQRP